MKRLFVLGTAALLAGSFPLARGEGPDDRYIEIYKLIQDGDQLVASGQAPSARQKYTEAQTELKNLQTAYPSWNQKLIEYRLRNLEDKLGSPAQAPPTLVESPTPGPAPVPSQAPGVKPVQPGPIVPVPTLTPQPPVPPEVDDRSSQIRVLQGQVSRLQNDNTVLEAKLREALSARPAAVEPRDLARAEEQLRSVEKEKEVLKVSLQLAEAKLAQRADAGAGETKKALAEARQKLTQQTEMLAALRQEKEILERRLQAAAAAGTAADSDMFKSLRAENDALKKQLAQAPAAGAQPGSDPAVKELASTKAALQSSRESMASLQVRLRTLEEERDRLEKMRHDLETRLASNSSAAAAAAPSESATLKQLRTERDELQQKLNDTTRQLTETKTRQSAAPQVSGELTSLRARLEALEARRVPYTPEELALFKQPDQIAVVTRAPAEEKPAKELPTSAAPLLAEAQRAFNARRFDEAEKKYLEVLQLDDKNVATLQRLASAQLEQNRLPEAEASLKRALAQSSKDPRSLLLMGIVNFEQNRYDEALDHLSRSAQLDAQNPETQNYLGITLSQKGLRAAAETALRKAVQLSPTYSSAHYNLAVVYATQQPPFTELARWHYQKALAYGHKANPDLEKVMDRKPAVSQK